MTMQLYRYSKEKIVLNDALKTFTAKIPCIEPVPALVYSFDRCEFAILTSEGLLLLRDGRECRLGRIYEIRIFHKDTELRWLNDPSPEKRHRSIIISEMSQEIDWEPIQPLVEVIESIDGEYLLWGQGSSIPKEKQNPNDWSQLSLARIGILDVPVRTIEEHSCVKLKYREYITQSDFGNAVIIEERLLSLFPEKSVPE